MSTHDGLTSSGILHRRTSKRVVLGVVVDTDDGIRTLRFEGASSFVVVCGRGKRIAEPQAERGPFGRRKFLECHILAVRLHAGAVVGRFRGNPNICSIEVCVDGVYGCYFGSGVLSAAAIRPTPSPNR